MDTLHAIWPLPVAAIRSQGVDMWRFVLLAFVALVGCSEGAYCEGSGYSGAECPPFEGLIPQPAWCVAPGVDAQSCMDDAYNCEKGVDLARAPCDDDEPTCPDGWDLHCYDYSDRAKRP